MSVQSPPGDENLSIEVSTDSLLLLAKMFPSLPRVCPMGAAAYAGQMMSSAVQVSLLDPSHLIFDQTDTRRNDKKPQKKTNDIILSFSHNHKFLKTRHFIGGN